MVIIGNSTSVSVAFNNGPTINEGFISTEWSTGTQPNRLYTLGMGFGSCGTKEFAIIRPAQLTVSFSIYGSITPEVSLCPTEICQNSPASAIITIVPGVCGNIQVDTFNHQVFFNSYSYSKDRTQFGSEVWQGMAYVSGEVQRTGNCNEYIQPEPDLVVAGVAEGTLVGDSSLVDLQSITGARIRDDACVATTTKGSVQANQMSIGEYEITYHSTFKSIGDSEFWMPGKKANASVTINLQDIYLGL
jgi:hypothetical protein